MTTEKLVSAFAGGAFVMLGCVLFTGARIHRQAEEYRQLKPNTTNLKAIQLQYPYQPNELYTIIQQHRIKQKQLKKRTEVK